MNNDLVILLCGVILLVAVLPMILMGRAFKGAGRRKEAPRTDSSPAFIDPVSAQLGLPGSGSGKAKSGHGTDDSGGFGDSGGGDGGGGGE